jgi:hypothetical protein
LGYFSRCWVAPAFAGAAVLGQRNWEAKDTQKDIYSSSHSGLLCRISAEPCKHDDNFTAPAAHKKTGIAFQSQPINGVT